MSYKRPQDKIVALEENNTFRISGVSVTGYPTSSQDFALVNMVKKKFLKINFLYNVRKLERE